MGLRALKNLPTRRVVRADIVTVASTAWMISVLYAKKKYSPSSPAYHDGRFEARICKRVFDSLGE
jgi:hypothetical protein